MNYPRLLIIPTEKRLPKDIQTLKRVLQSCDEQIEPFDEVILIKNYDQYYREEFGDGKRTLLTELNYLKTDDYQMCSVINHGFDYVKKKYASYDKIFMAIMGDDCVMQNNFLSTVISYSDEKYPAAFNPRIIHCPWTPNLDLPLAESHGVTEILSSISQAIKPKNHMNSLLGWLWHVEDWDIQYDEDYNGSWGLKDTDFALQLIDRGYRIIPMYDVRVWHVVTGWKVENHLPMSHETRIVDNKNWKHLLEKWKKYV